MAQLEQIEVFIRVVEAGGIGKAAEQLDVAKSAVSRRLADLESQLGVKLLHRNTRQSRLTEEGQRVYDKALAVREAVNALQEAASPDQAELTGTLRVSLPLSFGLAHLTQPLQTFAERWPQLKLSMDFSDRQVGLIEEGFDLALRIGELEASNLQARKLAPIRLLMVASPDYLAHYGALDSTDDFDAHPVLRYEGETHQAWTLQAPNGEWVTVQQPVRMMANNGQFLMEMACAGLGLTVAPEFIVREALEAGKLERVLPDHRFPELALYAVYPQNRYLSAKARTFIDFLVNWFERAAAGADS
ncbi:MAG: LysR family transcriptional regulator [Hydrogenovibrio sp.]|uniref:LysR family transcriptional regulator n=1 Tax=Hydrogenovibrio sp. TaxID=2065821 RepID=UPI00286FB4A7|nr:LysR family transcriptional regulator [Hydrogenovibrio sp.]MDR9499380.1 LysR family transcriptional regulator [Hydrogenovibrio sp.]